jgi:hypothetical protein
MHERKMKPPVLRSASGGASFRNALLGASCFSSPDYHRGSKIRPSQGEECRGETAGARPVGGQSSIVFSKDLDWEKVAGIFAPEKEDFFRKLSRGVDRYPYTGELLGILAAVGFLSLAVVMPGLATVVARNVRAQQRSNFRRRLRRLKERKLVEVAYDDKGEPVVKITQEGVQQALRYKFDEMKIKKPKQWDGQWRIVIFDVGDSKRRLRDLFRDKLERLGFYSLNESVFVHPFPCLNEIEFIRQVYEIGGEVTYIEASRIEGQDHLLSHFDLAEEGS